VGLGVVEGEWGGKWQILGRLGMTIVVVVVCKAARGRQSHCIRRSCI